MLLFQNSKSNCNKDHWCLMDIAPNPLWTNYFLSKHECDFVSMLIKKWFEPKGFISRFSLLMIFVH